MHANELVNIDPCAVVQSKKRMEMEVSCSIHKNNIRRRRSRKPSIQLQDGNIHRRPTVSSIFRPQQTN